MIKASLKSLGLLEGRLDHGSPVRYLGWLLHVNRRLGPDEALRSGRTFARAFRGHGREQALAPSQVTRWESGQHAPDRSAIRRYEKLLGLTPESLVTVADALIRSDGNGAFLRDNDRDHTDDSRETLYHLLDRVTTVDAMVGADWSALTELTASRPHLELYPPKLWRDIAGRLLGELVGSGGSEWLQRQEAMSRLLRHPSARPHAIAACIAMADDASSPAVIEPISLLDATPDPVANRYVLRRIAEQDDERAVQGALRAAIRKISQGHFQSSESAQLVSSISGLLNDSALNDTVLPLAVETARQLAQQPAYSDQLARRLPATALTRQIWTTRRIADPTAARVVSARITARTQSQVPHQTGSIDAILATLVEESLFLPHPDRSLVANMVIAATPYREPFAYALLEELTTDLANRRGACPLTTALSALTRVRTDIHRPLINEILARPGFEPIARHAAAWATPFCAGRFTDNTWREIFTAQLTAWRQDPRAIGESIMQGITYGIGTDGHHGLLADIRDHPLTPSAARTMASWLLRTTSADTR